jgi:Heavy metal binding domain
MRFAGALAAVLAVMMTGACKRSGTAQAPANAEAVSTRLPTQEPSTTLAFVCPMDRDVRSNAPGKCPRCGMALVAGIPDPTEYHLDLAVGPQPPQPNETVRLTFEVFDPWKDRPVTKFTVIHEKLFHAFIVSRDLQFFVHDHPTWQNGAFHYDVALPKPGMYRILGDFYPEGATPQLITKTIFVSGTESPPAPLSRDYSTKRSDNLQVALSTNPSDPVAGMTTQMRFALAPGDGLQKYLGAWAHMLAASDDLIDMMHTHPFIADGGSEMQFNLVFPRPRMHRVWVQFQRDGVINTVHFDVPVNRAAAPSVPSN